MATLQGPPTGQLKRSPNSTPVARKARPVLW